MAREREREGEGERGMAARPPSSEAYTKQARRGKEMKRQECAHKMKREKSFFFYCFFIVFFLLIGD